MTPRQQTQLLIVMLIASAISAGVAWSGMNSCKERAIASQNDQTICLNELNAITAANSTPGHDKSGSTDDLAINQRLRGAAVSERLSDQLVSIDPGAAVRLPESDYLQTPIYLRLNAVSLKQLIGFLYELSSADNSLQASDIELSIPVMMPSNRSEPGEMWTADITISYLSYEQRPTSESR